MSMLPLQHFCENFSFFLRNGGDQSHIIGNNGRQWIRQEAHGQLELKIERTNGLNMKVSAFPNFISVV
jgi:hypothetical protein